MRELISFFVALAASAIATPLVMVLARRYELVAKPSASRWHRRPTALMGGVAIFIAFVLPAVFMTPFSSPVARLQFAGLLIGSTLMFLLGLVDDFLHLKPSTKLIGQITAACVLIYCGVSFGLLGIPLLTIPLTILWVVGITNAFNLLDNMDGLAAGVAALCSFAIFAINKALGIDQSIGLVAMSFCGALVGFLFYNFNPARIFMGDSGSMMVGFTLAGLSIIGTWQQASNTFLLLVVPVLILAVPIFDTTFVTVTRRLRGQPVSVGGRDHTSHRLVALGLSERRAVLIFYGICASFGAIAALSLRYDAFVIGIVVILALTVVLIFGMFLGESRLYQPVGQETAGEEKARPEGFVYGTFIMHKRRMVEVLIDLCLCGAALVGAYLIRFEGSLNPVHEQLLLLALPVVIPIKILTFWGFGLYRRIWDFMGVHDLLALGKAVLTSSLVSILALWGLTRLEGYSRAVFLLDGILLLVFAAGSRVLFRVFQETLRAESQEGRRLLIIGAGRAGELVLREVRRQPELGYRTMGFVDDNPEKWGRGIHGVHILGGRDVLPSLASRDAFDEIVIAIPSLGEEDRESLVSLCQATGRKTRVMQHVSSTFLH